MANCCSPNPCGCSSCSNKVTGCVYPNPCSCNICYTRYRNTCESVPAACVTSNPTWGELTARVVRLESIEGLLCKLSKRQASVGDVLAKFEIVCQSNNQLVQAVAELQTEVQALKNCNAGPTIVSVIANP